jgi:hypothetical protein
MDSSRKMFCVLLNKIREVMMTTRSNMYAEKGNGTEITETITYILKHTKESRDTCSLQRSRLHNLQTAIVLHVIAIHNTGEMFKLTRYSCQTFLKKCGMAICQFWFSYNILLQRPLEDLSMKPIFQSTGWQYITVPTSVLPGVSMLRASGSNLYVHNKHWKY